MNWPAPGKVFADTANLKDGALAGSWNTKPKVVSLITENAELCPLIGGLLEPVGGLYLANSTPVISDMPEATADKPEPRKCDPGTKGAPGSPQSDCTKDVPTTCPQGYHGTPPNCIKDVDKPDPTPYKVSKAVLSPSKGKIKAGKTLKLKIKVTNSGQTSGSTNVTVKSSNGKVTVPKKVKISVPAGKTASKTITVKASKKAKGKATITAKAASKTATAKLTVKAAKKKKKK